MNNFEIFSFEIQNFYHNNDFGMLNYKHLKIENNLCLWNKI